MNSSVSIVDSIQLAQTEEIEASPALFNLYIVRNAKLLRIFILATTSEKKGP